MNHMFSEEQISALVQNIPKYVYIKIALTNRIKSGELEVGAKLSTEKEMCDLYGCSRLTVRKALEELTREGYIYKIQGRALSSRSVRRRSRISLSSQAVPRSSARRT